MVTRHAIQVLLNAGHTQREIAQLTGVPKRDDGNQRDRSDGDERMTLNSKRDDIFFNRR